MTSVARFVLGIVTAAVTLQPLLPSPPSLPAARDVIRRHIDAIGGAEALSRVRSRYIRASYEIPARRLRGSVEVYAARPNKRLIKVMYPEIGAETSAFDGVRGWTIAATGRVKAVTAKQLLELRDQSVFDF